MLARLRTHALLHLDQVAVCRPRVGRAAWDFVVAEVLGCGAAVLCGAFELPRGIVVEPRCLAQFQTLTSR